MPDPTPAPDEMVMVAVPKALVERARAARADCGCERPSVRCDRCEGPAVRVTLAVLAATPVSLSVPSDDAHEAHCPGCEDPSRYASQGCPGVAGGVDIDAVRAEERAKAEAEIARLRALIHRDRSGLAETLDRVLKAARARRWILDGRGSYEWNDEGYRQETRKALDEIESIAQPALVASGNLAFEAFHGAAGDVGALATAQGGKGGAG